MRLLRQYLHFGRGQFAQVQVFDDRPADLPGLECRLVLFVAGVFDIAESRQRLEQPEGIGLGEAEFAGQLGYALARVGGRQCLKDLQAFRKRRVHLGFRLFHYRLRVIHLVR